MENSNLAENVWSRGNLGKEKGTSGVQVIIKAQSALWVGSQRLSIDLMITLH